jgi:hypothetical protein
MKESIVELKSFVVVVVMMIVFAVVDFVIKKMNLMWRKFVTVVVAVVRMRTNLPCSSSSSCLSWVLIADLTIVLMLTFAVVLFLSSHYESSRVLRLSLTKMNNLCHQMPKHKSLMNIHTLFLFFITR